MKKLILCFIPMIVACTPVGEIDVILPNGLQDCKAYYLKASGTDMRVLRCPNSSTSSVSRVGKNAIHSGVIEDPVQKVDDDVKATISKVEIGSCP